MAGAAGATSSLGGLAGALGPIGAAAGIASSLFGIYSGIRQMKEAKKIKPVFNQYERSKYAEQMLGQAQSRLNAQDPYAAAQRRATLGSQANAMASMQNAALDPSQILQMTAALQGNTDQALFQQEQQNAQNYAQREANLYNAQNVNIAEDGKIYQSMMDKYQMDMNQKNALRNAGQQSITGGIAGIGETLLGSAMLAKEGYMNLGNKNGSGKSIGQLPLVSKPVQSTVGLDMLKEMQAKRQAQSQSQTYSRTVGTPYPLRKPTPQLSNWVYKPINGRGYYNEEE